MTPEEELILALTRPAPDLIHARTLVANGIDWKKVAGLSGAQGAHYLLGHRLAGIGVPPDVRRAFATSRLTAQLRLRQYRAGLAPLLESGLPLLLMKGAALAGRIFPSGARSLYDFDVLVPRAARGEAIRILESHGFEKRTRYGMTVEQTLRDFHELEFHKRDLCVDLHWRLYPDGRAFDISVDELFADASRDGTVHVMSPEHTLAHYGTQLVNDKLEFTYGRVVDIAHIAADRPDWPRVIDIAVRAGAAGATRLALEMARVLGVHVPANVLDRLEEHCPGASVASRFLADPRLLLGRRVVTRGVAIVLLPLFFARTRNRVGYFLSLPLPRLGGLEKLHALKPLNDRPVYNYRRRAAYLAMAAAAAPGLVGIWEARKLRMEPVADALWRTLFPLRRARPLPVDAGLQGAEQMAV